MNINYPEKDIHALTIDETVNKFQSDITQGLTETEASNRRAQFGANVYQAQKQKSLWQMLLHQFQSPIVYLLLVGTAVSLYFKDYVDAIAIMVVVIVNAIIGFLMELQARNSMNALREMDVITSKVLRSGKTLEIASEELTPGDVVLLEAGDVIPGDGRLLEANQFQCDESSLTGESLPSEKNTEKLPLATVLGDRFNMVFKGTSVMNGTGKAIITGIALDTELGNITSLVDKAEETKTPLDKKLGKLSKRLIYLTLIFTVVFAISGYIQGLSWILIIKTSIALAVAAFPEGLPIVATVALAYGMVLMARKNVIVKKLSSVETLGSTNVILTDKTGTLTENKIFVEILSFPEEAISVTTDKNILKINKEELKKSEQNFEKLKLIGALCNNATEKTSKSKKKLAGDPIEIALIHFSNSFGEPIEKLRKQYKRMEEIPFSSDTKMMGTLHKSGDSNFAAAKGSVEHLLENCTKIQKGEKIIKLNDSHRKSILEESEKMAANGLRVIAFAYRDDKELNKDNFIKDLIYVGMIGFLDPPRLDIKDSITLCRKAGIKIVMITGDHPMTALNIAKKVGLVDEDEENVINGKDLPAMEKLSAKWKKIILSTAVFARTTPKQKLDIAEIYQKVGNIVAMTGDGINDAPALKKADVGIAMGLRGTQVAKETASIVLKDDSFKSIVMAVAHGRTIFQNIQKFVIYLVSCNLSEIFIVTTLGFISPAATLLPLQILFLNMVTDVFPALALGVGKNDKSVMDHPPREASKDIISNKSWIAITAYALIMTAAVVIAVIYAKKVLGVNDQVANNVAFITLTFAQLFHVFNMSSVKSNWLINEITKNKFVWFALLTCNSLFALVYIIPPMRNALKLTQMPINLWLVCIIAGFVPLLLIQIYKAIVKKVIS